MAERMARRIQGFGTSIFTEMTALAIQHGAINLSQGFPDFAGPEFIKEAAIAAIQADQNQYAPAPGVPALRSSIAAQWSRLYGHEPSPVTEVTITSGATEGLLAAILALINPGDEVLLFEPTYDAYVPDLLMAGALPRYLRLQEPEWQLDLEQLRAAISPQTRAIMLNTPQNPTGKVFSEQELQAIAALAIEHDLLVITDEVYERLTFDGQRHIPIATLPGMWERTVTISSTGKTFSLTGWKIGYIIANPELTTAVRRSHQFITFATATPLQVAMAEAVASLESYEPKFLDFYNQRRAELVGALEEAGFKVYPPQGTYFVMADFRPLGFSDDVEFCRFLTTEVGVAAIPPSAFYHDGYQSGLARFCFAKSSETIAAAAERLAGLRVRI